LWRYKTAGRLIIWRDFCMAFPTVRVSPYLFRNKAGRRIRINLDLDLQYLATGMRAIASFMAVTRSTQPTNQPAQQAELPGAVLISNPGDCLRIQFSQSIGIYPQVVQQVGPHFRLGANGRPTVSLYLIRQGWKSACPG
jgi:hypothetical protein